MKKIIIFCLVLLLSIPITFAENSEKINISDTDFSSNCFEFYSGVAQDSFSDLEVFKYLSEFKDPVFIQSDYLLPVQTIDIDKRKYLYSSEDISNLEYVNDDNKNTFISHDTAQNPSITLNFGEFISNNNLSIYIDFTSKFHTAHYQISADNEKYINVDLKDVSTYGFQYFRINFIKNPSTNNDEKIIIRELIFSNDIYSYLVKNYSNQNIQIYANNKCPDMFSDISYSTSLSSNVDTKEISTYFEENPSLVANPEADTDNDGTLDKYDNCPIISNPKQQDSNSNGIGDLCADDDADHFYGDKDNCIYIYNPDQTDINQNGIGDVCEFDIDKDGIFDAIDNCRNTSNPDQIDTDKDNIGDACDNCSLYNPNQRDKNQNGIGDYCEETEKYLEENDDDGDKIINYKDNCRYIANANQLDSDKDSIGDVCDNCKNIQNKNQIDKNTNGIGDYCEDSDNDSVEGYLDNCIHISNPDQKDDDNNGVGNLCEDSDYDRIVFADDNCPFTYNPDQSDIDKDSIGDKCDESDERFMESNKTFFILLLLVIVGLFGFGIFSMMKKLK